MSARSAAGGRGVDAASSRTRPRCNDANGTQAAEVVYASAFALPSQHGAGLPNGTQFSSLAAGGPGAHGCVPGTAIGDEQGRKSLHVQACSAGFAVLLLRDEQESESERDRKGQRCGPYLRPPRVPHPLVFCGTSARRPVFRWSWSRQPILALMRSASSRVARWPAAEERVNCGKPWVRSGCARRSGRCRRRRASVRRRDRRRAAGQIRS